MSLANICRPYVTSRGFSTFVYKISSLGVPGEDKKFNEFMESLMEDAEERFKEQHPSLSNKKFQKLSSKSTKGFRCEVEVRAILEFKKKEDKS